ncbi:GIY-YIG nuclease family protein [Bacillus sp. 37MA]|uniref:GIY-YIG nuclease family protein n=1 Tax=Bacillus sp. 37MA TaxID=1132442 RepID=UPI00036C5225|nr:GIY-YIG nuclease family protein [Bacillus sp. 37MA]
MINKIEALLKENGYAFDPESWNSINMPYTKTANTPVSLDFIQHQLGTTAGIYLFKSANDEILYIGKGAPLFKRIKSHYNKLSIENTRSKRIQYFQSMEQKHPTIFWLEINDQADRELVEHMLAYTLKPLYKKHLFI